MKYRYRIWLILLLIGLIPLLVASLETLQIVNQIHAMPIDQSLGRVKDIEINSIRQRFIITYSVIGFIVLVTAYFISGRISSPVEWMAASASQFLRIMQNIWKSLQPPDTKNEMITLGYTFRVFTQQIREEIANLETQVKTRTADLTKRTAQLETAAQVAQESAAILDIDQLLNETTRLISDRFGYYHVGIFLLGETTGSGRNEVDGRKNGTNLADDSSQKEAYIILRAANSEGGRRMLARGHKLRVGQGIVGTVAVKNESRIATDVGSDAAYFNNPDLPQTHSELALPLRVRTRLIGVLDVQSTETEAYNEDDVKILQILADQLALAIDNARLIKESQRNLHALELAYGQESKKAWERRLANKPMAYIYDRVDVHPIPNLPHSQSVPMNEDPFEMEVPIVIRDQVIGNVTLRRNRDMKPWNKGERLLAEDAVSQIASALENARLLEDIRSRARQEQRVNVISTNIRSAPTTDSILRNTIRELGNALGASRTFIQLGLQSVEFGNGEHELNQPITDNSNSDFKENRE
jgi:GAF domain-containing protein